MRFLYLEKVVSPTKIRTCGEKKICKIVGTMPKTNSKTYDKQSLLTLAERLEAFAQRYRSMAASVGEETIELLNQSSLEKSLAFLRIHAGKATMSVEKFVEDRTIQDLASESIASEIKKKPPGKKKPKQ